MKRLYTRRDILAAFTGGALTGAVAAAWGQVPGKTSRVVSARFAGNVHMDSDDLGTLIDKSITRMSGAHDPAAAWSALFSGNDHVSIKVNCLGGPAMSTNPHLVAAVVGRLKKCGVKARRIIIWDRMSRELREAGFELSRGGSGPQCYGTDEAGYERDLRELGSVASLFSRILTDRCNKIINMPVLKDHNICGLTFALKNYFGAIHNPNKFHLNRCLPYIGDLNSIDTIRDKETLIVGDLTRIQAEGGPSYKSRWCIPYGGVLLGRDPVSTDAAALGILQKARKDLGVPDLGARDLYPDYIKAAAAIGVGSIEGMEHIEIKA